MSLRLHYRLTTDKRLQAIALHPNSSFGRTSDMRQKFQSYI